MKAVLIKKDGTASGITLDNLNMSSITKALGSPQRLNFARVINAPRNKTTEDLYMEKPYILFFGSSAEQDEDKDFNVVAGFLTFDAYMRGYHVLGDAIVLRLSMEDTGLEIAPLNDFDVYALLADCKEHKQDFAKIDHERKVAVINASDLINGLINTMKNKGV